jgi:cytochrome c556
MCLGDFLTMIANRRLVAAIALLAMPAWSALATAPDPVETEGIIYERQQIMEQLGRDSDLLGKVVAGLEPASKLPEVSRAIADGARQSLEAYRQQVPGGRTKAEAWSNNADFMRRMEDFVRNAEAMAAVGARGDVTGVTGMLVDAMPCKQCHDVYRAPKAN